MRSRQEDDITVGAGQAPDMQAGTFASLADPSLLDRLPLLGPVAWLYAQTPSHRQLFIQDLDWRTLPPLILGQYRIYVDHARGGTPWAFASWARLNPDAEADYLASGRIASHQWNAGDRLWLFEVVAPFGGVDSILGELFHQVLARQEVRLLYPDAHHRLRPVTLGELVGVPEPETPSRPLA
jgi:cytolysin-activating lysine-acyltransferase